MRKRFTIPEGLAPDILGLLNRAGKKIDAIREIGRLIKKRTGIEAVGVRLREGDDYPYYVTRGFPAVFVEAENFLCACDPSGEPLRDAAGNPVLECMCGNIIQGRTDPSLHFFTEGGSFWTNSTTELLASTTEEERQTRTRNRCNGQGYESVALIPLRSDGEIIGLLQLNDRRRDIFTLELIVFFEKLGESIGVAIARQKAEAEVREKEIYLRSLLDQLLESVVVVDRDHLISDCNEATLRLTGRRRGEIIGRPCHQILLGYDKPCELYGETCHLRTVFKTGKPYSYEHVRLKKDGSRIWINIQLSPLRDAEGKITRVINAVRDITELKKSREKIEQLSKFPAENPNPVLRVAKDGAVIYANRSSAPLLKLWGCKAGRRLPPKLKKIIKESFDSGWRREIEVACEGRIFSLTFSPVSGTEYLSVYGLDITERKEAEKALLKERARLAKSQELGLIGTWDLNIEADELIWTDEVYRIFGVPRGRKLTYKKFLKLVHPDDREYVDTQWKATLKGDHHNFEHRIVVGGKVKWIREMAELEFDEKGKVCHGIGAAQDITERKKAEEAERLKQLNQAITAFMEAERKRVALDLHDEVGQLLTAIQMGLEMLLLDHPDLAGKVKEEVRSAVGLVERAGDEVHRISSRLRPEALDEFGLIPSIEHEIEFLKERSRIEFQFVAQGCWKERLDPQKEIAIYRVVRESLTNILKHSGAGRVEVTLNQKSGKVLLKILDDGRGFDPSELSETGGLGLLGMRERIEAVGGDFRIAARPGGGTLLEAEVPAG